MENGKKHQHLGSFLKTQLIPNIEIYFKTGIDPTRISKLSNPEKDTLTANEFYLIAQATNADLDKMAEHVFEEYHLNEIIINHNNAYKTLTKFGQFLNDGLILQKTVSQRTEIKESKLSILSNDHSSTPLAKEVYLASLVIHKKPSEAFKFISGHLQLNNLEEQRRLRKEYDTKLAVAKVKRETTKKEAGKTEKD